jgi:YD repeat-containing protein
MVDGSGTTNYGYNPITATPTLGAGQLASIDGPWANDTVAYTYDQLGRVVSRAINGVIESTTFDAAGRTGSINNALGTFNYTYDGATARVASVTHSGGVKSTYAYLPNSQDRRLQRITNLKADGVTPLSVFDYTYDAEGRILTWKQQQDTDVAGAKTWTLGYDNADQVTSAISQQGATVINNYGWIYDPAGNRKSETLDGPTTSFDYNSINELINSSANLPTATYEWDGEKRLVAVNQGTASSEFTYDGLGRRVGITEKSSGSVTSSWKYLWCGLQPCERRDTTGGILQQRYFAQGFQGISGTPTGIHVYTIDHLGSVRELVDTSGVLKERISYDVWGKPTVSNQVPIASFAFTGLFFHFPTALYLAAYRE